MSSELVGTVSWSLDLQPVSMLHLSIKRRGELINMHFLKIIEASKEICSAISRPIKLSGYCMAQRVFVNFWHVSQGSASDDK